MGNMGSGTQKFSSSFCSISEFALNFAKSIPRLQSCNFLICRQTLKYWRSTMRCTIPSPLVDPFALVLTETQFWNRYLIDAICFWTGHPPTDLANFFTLLLNCSQQKLSPVFQTNLVSTSTVKGRYVNGNKIFCFVSSCFWGEFIFLSQNQSYHQVSEVNIFFFLKIKVTLQIIHF